MTRPLLVLALTSCSTPDSTVGGAGGGPTGGGSATGGGTRGGTSDACVPSTCATANVACGQAPDGCGGVLSGGVCTCTPSTFATDCPSRPCEVATGCANDQCQYAPVTCGGDACSTCLSDTGRPAHRPPVRRLLRFDFVSVAQH